MYDINEEASQSGLARSRRYLDDLVRFDLLDGAAVQDAKERIKTVNSLAQLGEQAGLVQESVVERYDVKTEVTVQTPPSDSPRIDGFRSSTHPTTRCFWVGWVERSETHRRAGEGGV
jgi:3-hydroxyacyl-CoA dehydrogenase